MNQLSEQPANEIHFGLVENEAIDDFFKKLKDIEQQAKVRVGDDDIRHLLKLESWCNWLYLIGLGTAWILPNPISAFFLSQSKFCRWACLAHHVLHGAYNHIDGVPNRLTSDKFARGIRRFTDWFDWILPSDWVYEHNFQHHYHLGEKYDPDLVEENLQWLRDKKYPNSVKWFIVFILACTWKFTYYNSNTILENYKKKRGNTAQVLNLSYAWNLKYPPARRLILLSILPYFCFNFVFLPSLFLFISPTAALYVLINLVLAEVFTNLHSFIMIVTNHSGSDIFRFTTKISEKREFFIRQIVGSTNYKTGGDFNDFFHGFLNYQIEHHLWPKMTLKQYQFVQPKVKKLCHDFGIPYHQESFMSRLKKTVNVMIGVETMKVV
ncbi:MAG: fatty acid desaturase [Bacteroidota bacterium]